MLYAYVAFSSLCACVVFLQLDRAAFFTFLPGILTEGHFFFAQGNQRKRVYDAIIQVLPFLNNLQDLDPSYISEKYGIYSIESHWLVVG